MARMISCCVHTTNLQVHAQSFVHVVVDVDANVLRAKECKNKLIMFTSTNQKKNDKKVEEEEDGEEKKKAHAIDNKASFNRSITEANELKSTQIEAHDRSICAQLVLSI